MSMNSYESFSEDVGGCMDGCSEGCSNVLGCITLVLLIGLVTDLLGAAREWVIGHPYVAGGIAVVIVGGILGLYLNSRRRRST